jgi:subtilisin family serine protease
MQLALTVLLLVTLISPSGRAGEPTTAAAATRASVESLGLPCLPSDWAVIQSDAAAAQPPAAAPTQSAPAVVANGAKSLRAMHWEFANAASCKAYQQNGVTFLTRFDRFADVLFDPTDPKVVAALKAVKGLRWAELASASVTPPPPPVKPDVEQPRALPEAVARGGYAGLTGRGVLVAVIDTGIDFHHPDFIAYDAAGQPTSRIRYFWDTLHNYRPGEPGGPSPVSFPGGSSIGTIYSRDQLTADLRAAQSQLTGTDLNGHGTSCAGIAAGNGNALRRAYMGVAPEADLIVVRIGDSDGKMVSQYLTGAICDWLDKVAGSTPLVVSCSFGGTDCGHDGYRILERQFDVRFPLDRAGRAILIAAGNNGAKPMHVPLTIGGPSAPAQLSWACPNATTLQIYVQTNNRDLQVTAGTDLKLPAPTIALHSLTGQMVILQNLPPGSGSLSVASKTDSSFRADAYLLDTAAKFTSPGATQERMIDEPACSANVITVGSYNFNNLIDVKGKILSLRDAEATNRSMTIGELSAYSCPGFWRFGTATKPEITAPGQWWAAPAAAGIAKLDAMRDSSGRYRLFNGTSAATPYAAGIIALAMQKNPKLTPSQIKNLFKSAASSDAFTGATPNIHWGYGKLDLAAVGRLIQQVPATK